MSTPSTGSTPSAPAPIRVCSFESRKSAEIASLIERLGGVATVAPSLREVPLEENPAAFEFAERLLAGKLDVVVFLTGVGARGLMDVLETRYRREAVLASLGQCTVVVRGPKPLAVLREWGLRVDFRVPEPNTWRELLETLDNGIRLAGKRLAVQEYGIPNPELYDGLRQRQTDVLAVPVYRWALPEETGPLKRAIEQIVAGGFDLLMFTSAQQIRNVVQVAEELGQADGFRAAAANCLIASIGPAASEALAECGFAPGFEASPPKMGHLVKGALELAAERARVASTGQREGCRD